MKTFGRNLHNSGFSMIELLMGLAIGAVVMKFSGDVLVNAIRGQNALEASIETVSATKYLMDHVDCAKSYTSGVTCRGGGAKALFDKNGATVVKNSGGGTKFGILTVRAECSTNNDALIIRAARLTHTGTVNSTASSDFAPDPFTKVVKTWSDPGTLMLPAGIGLCPIYGSTLRSSDYILLENIQPWGTIGGSCSPAKTWRTIVLNTESSDSNSSAVLNADSSFTFKKGTYECTLAPPFSFTGETRARLYNVTTSTVMVYSQSMRISVASPSVMIKTKFTLAVDSNLRLEGWCEGVGTGDALGVASSTEDSNNIKVPEVFAQVECRRYSD